MPAIMVLRSKDNPGAQDTGADYKPGVWRAGEVVDVFEESHTFGYAEIPFLAFGVRNVDFINNADPAQIPLYAHVRMTDSGTITTGSQGPLEVQTGDALIWQFDPLSDGYWVNYGFRENNDPGDFYHVRVSDKTVQEVNVYLEAYNKKLEYTSDQFDPGTDLRRFTTTNIRVSASGNNGFTADGINDAINTWNANYPDNTVALVDSDDLTYFQCDGIMPIELYDEWQQNTQQVALADYYARRRWYFTQAGLSVIAADDGTWNASAAEIAPYLRDGLLD